jgi:hypothetical protein
VAGASRRGRRYATCRSWRPILGRQPALRTGINAVIVYETNSTTRDPFAAFEQRAFVVEVAPGVEWRQEPLR